MRISRFKTILYNNVILYNVKEEYPEHSLFYINLDIPLHEDLKQLFSHLSDYLNAYKLNVLSGFAFGFKRSFFDDLPGILSDLIFLMHNIFAGCQIQLICTDSNKVISKYYQEGASIKTLDHLGSQLVYVSNIQPVITGNYYNQTFSSFMLMADIIRDHGISYKELVRTWLYVDNILDWYNTLNKVRNDFYRHEGIFDGLIPASTGIGLGNVYNKCILVNALCIKGQDTDDMIRMVDSPLQCSATDYKSSFSRGVEIKHLTSSRLLVSGTASISAGGYTLHTGSVKRQIDHTMKVVRALLKEENYEWENIVRAIAYFKKPEDIKYFRDYCLENDIDISYMLTVGGTICRDDLLFEIELDAVKQICH